MSNLTAKLTDFVGARAITLQYIGAVTLGLGAPLFEMAWKRSSQYPLTIWEALFFALVLEVALPLLLLALRGLAGRRRRLVDVLVYAVLVFLLARIAQRGLMDGLTFSVVPPFVFKAIFLAVVFAIVLLLLTRFSALARNALQSCAGLAPVIVAVFLWSVYEQPASLMAQAPGLAGKPAVITVVLDELSVFNLLGRSGDIDAEKFPNFASLKSSSVWFRNTTTSYGYTEAAFGTAFTGKETVPPDRQKPADTYLVNRFADEGYPVSLVSSVFWCNGRWPCRARVSGVFALDSVEGITRSYLGYIIPSPFIPLVAPSLELSVVDNETGRPQAMFKTIAPGGFYLFHTMLTHTPPIYRSDGKMYSLPLTSAFMSMTGNYAPFDDKAQYLLDEQTRYADAWLGILIGEMKARGVWDNSILVVMADHGSCYALDCHRTEASEIDRPTASLAFVPFFLRAPGLVPRVDDRPAELRDLVPTLLSLGPLKPSPEEKQLEGLNLLRDDVPATRKRRLLIPTRQPAVFFELPSTLPASGDTRYDLQYFPGNASGPAKN